jgi:hypothetical protein
VLPDGQERLLQVPPFLEGGHDDGKLAGVGSHRDSSC